MQFTEGIGCIGVLVQVPRLVCLYVMHAHASLMFCNLEAMTVRHTAHTNLVDSPCLQYTVSLRPELYHDSESQLFFSTGNQHDYASCILYFCFVNRLQRQE